MGPTASRRFALVAVALAALHCAHPEAGHETVAEADAAAGEPDLVEVSDGRYLMGTILDITLIGRDEAALRAAIEWAFARVAEIERVASTYRPDSDVTRFNQRAGRPPSDDYAPELRTLLEMAVDDSRRTRGAFDVTVGPLVDVWSRAAARGRWPTAATIASARARVGVEAIVLEPDGAMGLAWRGCAVDFGGLAKGFALDELHEGLVARGVTRGLLDFGGSSIWAMGQPREGGPWRFEVDVRVPDDPVRVVALEDLALSVSSSLGESSLIGSRVVGHVIDPRSGQTISESRTAVVISRSAARAEAWSTALVVLDAEEGELLAERENRIQAWVRQPSGEVSATPGFEAFWSTEPLIDQGPMLW